MENIKQTSKVKILVECSLMVAIGTILMMIKIFEMPSGGSITLVSMLPFILVSYRHGYKWGLLTGLVCAILQMITGWYAPPAGTISAYFAMVMLDYIIAFSILGLACLFSKGIKNPLLSIATGTIAVCLLRALCHFCSGFLIWASVVQDGIGAITYSLGYTSSYMIPETILTTIAIIIIYKAQPKLFGNN